MYNRLRLNKANDRYPENHISDEGLDVGDYEYLDNMKHCPAVDWVMDGKVLPQVKNQ